MSYIARRGLSSLVPPKVASAQNLGAAPNAKRMTNIVSFYKQLPRGNAPAVTPSKNPFKWYKQKYFDGDNASGMPFVHFLVGLVGFGYIYAYQTHLKHLKDGEHH
ncbi:hypothetical protein CANCADRAFT_32632 [Tortispora caseinolytica NRRL Y-17796]|uniref:Uncharacterized protein n=1 Tax=Tortispora caseinolytica NRRL Y-17796 TaxID=767744 RepID=A0A1E4TC53_9ASCO|nr:hypothetical protein CANCADRAFT_32632 [Tortispora caseinolytica NRRL Y-17796]